MLWLDGQEAGVLGAFCMFACPTLLGIPRFYRVLSKEGVEYSFFLGDPSPLRPVRILPLCLDALCQILINKMIPNCILSKEGYNTSCF